MGENKLKLSIVILSWNTKDLLKQCLESVIEEIGVRQLADGGCEVIVVDNASTDGSVDLVKSSKLKVQSCSLKLKVIENKENLGFSRANNQGIKEAQGEYIMLLNSDTVVRKGAIEKLVKYLDKHSEAAVVGPKLINIDGSSQANCGRFPNLGVVFVMLFKEHFGGSDFVRCSPKESTFVDWLMGAAFMVRREVFEKAGLLDETMFMYMEEVEWFYRVRKTRLRTYFLNEAEIFHLGRGSSKSGKKAPILNIYRGLLHFYKVHKNPFELAILRLMLKTKALISLSIGYLKNDLYLKETYGQAFKTA